MAQIIQFDGLIPTDFDEEDGRVTGVTKAQVFINVDLIESFFEMEIVGHGTCTVVTMASLDEILVEYAAHEFFTEIQLHTQGAIPCNSSTSSKQ
jgi:hypothetical protein